MGVHSSTAKESRLIRVLPSMRLVDPFNLKPEDIDIKDIAHHLARICQWNGGVNGFYSVAEHSIAVAKDLPDKYKLYGLLFNASDTYLGNVSIPLKDRLWESIGSPNIHYCAKFEWVENEITEDIYTKHDLEPFIPEEVRKADDKQLAIENELIEAGKLEGNYPNIAEARFLAVFNKLMEDRK